MMSILIELRRRTGPLLAGLAALLALLLWLSPAEQTLGQTVKLVYLHGALVRTAMALFALSLPVNLAALISKGSGWPSWGKALTWTAILVWLAHTLMSMVTTYAAWGVFIAWFEPRTRFTFALAGAALAIVVGVRLVNSPRFSALAFALLAGLTLGLAPRLGVVQHPLNPIGTSPSGAIRGFYAAILLVSLAMGGLLAVWVRITFTPEATRPLADEGRGAENEGRRAEDKGQRTKAEGWSLENRHHRGDATDRDSRRRWRADL